MADETKKYLINIESNLNKYAEDAAKAKEKVEELTESNKALIESGEATAAEIEASNAALRTAKKEYKEAQKLVDLQTQANNSNVNSRKQLAAIVEIEQKRLGALADTIKVNADGTRELSEEYIAQSRVLDNAKKTLIAYDQAQSDGRSNVGRYGESLQKAFAGIPGPLGNASNAVGTFNTALKALAKNPIVLVITAIVAALGLLIKAFKGNDEASEKFAGFLKGIGVIIKEVLGRVVSFGQAVVKLFKGDFKGAAESAREAFTGFGEAVKNAYKAGVEQQQLLNKIEDAEIEILERIAKRNKEIAQIKKDSRDEEEDAVKRKADLLKADELEKANLEDQLAIQRDRVKLAEMELKATNKNQITDEQRKKVAEEKAKLLDLETQSIERQASIQKRLLAVDREIEAEKKKINDEFERLLEIGREAEKDILKVEQEYAEQWNEIEKDLISREQEARFINEENLFQIKQARLTNEYELQRNELERQRQLEVANAEQTGADILLINQKYAAYQAMLDGQQKDARLAIYSEFAGSIAALFGEQTAIGKAAAIAQATISTYQAAAKALAVYPPPFSYVAAASAIAYGLANVQKIVSVKSGLPGESNVKASAPTAIAAPRATAQPVGATILQVPQLTQMQLNALPNNNNVDISDRIIEGMKNIKPVVTVEDINNRTASTVKVSSRANI